MKEIRDKVQSALRNVNPLAGLFDTMEKETDAVMLVFEAELTERLKNMRERAGSLLEDVGSGTEAEQVRALPLLPEEDE